MYTASHALLDSLTDCGVSHVFANFGSDHPGLIEAIAEGRATGAPMPRVITCPHEFVAMSAAHGFYQASGVAQAVVVHVDCGTQSLAGAIHNASAGRVPMLVFAGASPLTQHGEARGSRNEFIQWIQDVHDQRGLVRGYMKFDYELRIGATVADMVRRAFQLAYSDARGPVYLMGSREVMESEVAPQPSQARPLVPIAPCALANDDAMDIATALTRARRPIVVTSYAGRRHETVEALLELSRTLAVGVLESVPSAMNFPHDDVCHLGQVWNEQAQHPALAEADVILVIDSDVPWIPSVSRPASDAKVFHIDVDPLKERMPLFDVRASRIYRADALTALRQIAACLGTMPLDSDAIEARRSALASAHLARQVALRAAEVVPAGGGITTAFAMSCLEPMLGDDAMVFNEGITNYPVIYEHLRRRLPGSIVASGGGSLGWSGGAAVGASLARPDKTIIAVSGDGSFMFSVPSAVFWLSRRYDAPFLQVVLNNGGWNAPRFSALNVHRAGYASRAESLDLSFDPAPDYAGIAEAAGGARPFRVTRAEEVEPAFVEALRTVREDRRSAVVDLRLAG